MIKIVNIYKTSACSNPFEIEKEMHKHFEKYRIHGEWFSCDMGEVILLLDKLFAEKAKFTVKQYENNPLDCFVNNVNDEIKSKREYMEKSVDLVEFMVGISKEKNKQIERLICMVENLQSEIRIKNEQLEKYERAEETLRRGS